MNNKDIVSLVITWIRVPLMILVIFVHSSYECYPQYNENAPLWSGSGIFTFIGNCVSVFAHCGVPCFFVISGYLFLEIYLNLIGGSLMINIENEFEHY